MLIHSTRFGLLGIGVLLISWAHGGELPGKPKTSDQHGDPLPPGAIARMGTVRFRHAGYVCSAAFSPDGRTIASGGHDKEIRLWDRGTGKEIGRLRGHQGIAVLSLAYSPDGKTLAAGNWDDVIRIWDATTQKEVRQLGKKGDDLNWVAFSPDGKLLAATAEKQVRFWGTETWTELEPLVTDTGRIQSIAFSADSKRLLVGGTGDKVQLWDLATRKILVSATPSSSVNKLTISPRGDVLAAGCANGVLHLWDSATGDELRKLEGPSEGDHNGVSSVRFSPDSKMIAAAG